MDGKKFLGLSVGAMLAALAVVAIVGNFGVVRRIVFPTSPRFGA
jgi:hypothetical protein